MEKNAFISLQNGLGDKLLDLIGFYIICKYLHYIPFVSFNNDIKQFAWGNNKYDIKLFDLQGFVITNNWNQCRYYVRSPNPSASLCPYKVYTFLKTFLPEITFEEISQCYNLYSKEIIKPSEIILSKIPNNIENAYGIHLRKSDKVGKNVNIIHENLIDEFSIITNQLLFTVKDIIVAEDDPTFIIVSEDDEWKNEIKEIIQNIAIKKNKVIQILEIDYTNENNFANYKSVLDMFCLSKCKEILQGVKYSTFSILASILGNCKLRNYSNYLDSNNLCLIYSWNSVVEINWQINFDKDFHERITNNVSNIETNIHTTE
jgi:hypothetical protein